MFGRETQGIKISPPAPNLSCGLCVISRQTGLSAYGWSMCLRPKTEIGSGWQAEKNLVGRAERGYNGCATNTTINRQGDRMVRHTVFGFKLAYREESMTAHGGVALLAECTHGAGAVPPRGSARAVAWQDLWRLRHEGRGTNFNGRLHAKSRELF